MALLAPKAACTQSGMETSLQRCYSACDGPGQMPPSSCSTALGSKRAVQETELSLCWSQFLTKNQLTAKTLEHAISFPVLCKTRHELVSQMVFSIRSLEGHPLTRDRNKAVQNGRVLNANTAHL